MNPEPTSRPYRSTLRQEQARRTRAAVLDAARRLFCTDGYAATTMRAIAAEAGVSVETVHAQGGKAALLLAVVDRAIAGDDEPVPLLERPPLARVLQADDPRQKLALLREAVVEGLEPVVPVFRAFQQAAAADPAVAPAWREYEQRRHEDFARIAATFAAALRPGLDAAGAADVLWTVLSPQVIDMLVGQRGWTVPAYADWVADTLERLLLG
ncbi:helix-turn-helix domain-containing protein [Kineococcus glutinatus]|uniref:TetR/AcrR family transcriptional regulator n=1 Tax=Kineococcus glutinatus TaxID=1070872 RepID=A0ABP9HDF6_9ACTN